METKVYLAAHGLIEREGLYLLTRRSAVNDYMPRKWDIPGGTVEFGEDPREGLTREVQEETGLDVVIEEPLFIYNNMGQFPSRQTFQAIYRCRYLGGDIRLNPEEHDEFEWCTFGRMAEMELIAFLSEFVNKTHRECS